MIRSSRHKLNHLPIETIGELEAFTERFEQKEHSIVVKNSVEWPQLAPLRRKNIERSCDLTGVPLMIGIIPMRWK
jgi:hypothetical protein